jgi:hypothetical protein
MDKVSRYRQIIQQVLEDYAKRMSQGSQVKLLPICDTVHDQYLLVSLGRQNGRREHAIVFHVQLCQGQFLLEDDRTEEGIGNLLADSGVDPQDIKPSWVGHSHVADEMPLVA